MKNALHFLACIFNSQKWAPLGLCQHSPTCQGWKHFQNHARTPHTFCILLVFCVWFFNLQMHPAGSVPDKSTMRLSSEGKKGQESWIFKDHLLQAEEWCIPTQWKSGKKDKRPAWMNKELLSKLTQKGSLQMVETRTGSTWRTKSNCLSTQGSGEKSHSRDRIKSGQGGQGNKKSFYSKLVIKGRPEEVWGPSRKKWETWLHGTGRRLRFSTAFLPWSSLARAPTTIPRKNEGSLTVGDNQVWDHLRNLKVHRSLRPGGLRFIRDPCWDQHR